MNFSDKFKTFYPKRYLGIYTSRGDNELVSIRIRQGKDRDPSKWYWNQLEKLAEISKTYGNGKVHFTTRGDTELYGISYKNIEKVIELLNSVELDPRDSCGASVRNVIPCPYYICSKARVNSVNIAVNIANIFRHNPEYEYPRLPKRIKISVSACERGCANPTIMDVGIVATEKGFDVFIGGGIGDYEFQGVKLFEGISEKDLTPICIAVADILKEENEKRGFKWVVNKYGIEKIREMILERANKIPKRVVSIKPDLLSFKWIARVYTKNGWMSYDEVFKISKIAKENLGFVVLFNLQVIDIPIINDPNGFDGLNFKLIKEFDGEDKVINACIGNDYCPPAIIDTNYVADQIRKNTNNIRVGISGCAHSCGKHQVTELGFMGVMRDGRAKLLVYIGGNNYTIGKPIGEIEINKVNEVVKAYSDIFKGEFREDKIQEFKNEIEKINKIK
ncbi:MAG: nitrite/sulfite reductase [Ignisphaera sp.]